MQIEAFLCDAATVRENLLHVLGGGVTRIWPPTFPGKLGLDLALMLTLTQTEAQEKHRIRVVVQTADGKALAEAKAEFKVAPGPDVQPGERVGVPLAFSLTDVPIPGEGVYSVEVLIDGQLQRSFSFAALTKRAG